MDFITDFLRFMVDFLVVTVFMKIILGRRVAEYIENQYKNNPIKFERLVAIWQHEHEYHDGNPSECIDTRCQRIFVSA